MNTQIWRLMMNYKYKISHRLKDAIRKSKKNQYELAQSVDIDRALLSIFMNKAYISEFYKNKIIKIGKLVDIPDNECLEPIKDQKREGD
jgi:hypothetical protein